MSTGLSPLMNNLKMDTINEEFWDQLFDLHRRLLTTIPKNRRDYCRGKIKTFYSKYTERTSA
jgi:hypothetical protein